MISIFHFLADKHTQADTRTDAIKNNICFRLAYLARRKKYNKKLSYRRYSAHLRFQMPFWFAIYQISSAVSSASSPQHFRDPCTLCRRANSLEFTARSFARSSCWLWTI